MTKIIFKILLLTLFSLLSFLSSKQVPNQTRDKIFKIDGHKRLQKISTSINKEFFLKFDSIPSTGYNWYLVYNSDKSHMIAYDLEKDNSSKIYENADKQNMRAGANGFTYFKLKATRKGKYTLDFIYQQSWDPKNDDLYIQVDIYVN